MRYKYKEGEAVIRKKDKKLKIDFPTQGNLEIFLTSTNKWIRVTATDFRSFDGKRRITLPVEVILGDCDVKMETQEYNGPVYKYGTNVEVEKINNAKIRYINQIQ